MYEVTLGGYADALMIHPATAGRRLAAHRFRTAQHGTKFFRLADVLPTINAAKERCHLERLFDAATPRDGDRDSVYLDDDAAEIAERLEGWLRDDAKERARTVRARFTSCLANSTKSSEIFLHHEGLSQKLIVANPILPWVAVGDLSAVPHMRDWSWAFAITNLTCDQKEAA